MLKLLKKCKAIGKWKLSKNVWAIQELVRRDSRWPSVTERVIWLKAEGKPTQVIKQRIVNT